MLYFLGGQTHLHLHRQHNTGDHFLPSRRIIRPTRDDVLGDDMFLVDGRRTSMPCEVRVLSIQISMLAVNNNTVRSGHGWKSC